MKERIKEQFKFLGAENFKDFVFGFQDGLVSTYVLLAGIAILVTLNPVLLVITLLAEIASGAISMTFGAYTSTKTEYEYLDHNEISQRKINFKEGLSKKEDEEFNHFLDTHPKIREKIKLFKTPETEKLKDPLNKGMLMGFSFICGGIIPLSPYLFPVPIWSFIWASIFTFLALIMIGILRSLIAESKRSWLRFSLEMIGLGVIAVIIIQIYLYFISLSYGLLIWA